MSKKQKNIWRNRIVGEGERAAKDFVLNPLNFRTHPDLQQEAMAAILGEIGWVQRVLVNRTTGNVIDGELRVKEALKKGKNTLVPFVEVELTEDEERKVLALFDKISAMAGKNVEMYLEISELVDFESTVLDQILKDMRDDGFDINDFFKDNPLDGAGDEFVLEIEFDNETDFEEAKAALEKIDKSPAKALQKLLSL